jgi:hypothetical protein
VTRAQLARDQINRRAAKEWRKLNVKSDGASKAVEVRRRYSVTLPAGNSVTKDLTEQEVADYQRRGYKIRMLGDLHEFRFRHELSKAEELAARLQRFSEFLAARKQCSLCGHKVGGGDRYVIAGALDFNAESDEEGPQLLDYQVTCDACLRLQQCFEIRNPLNPQGVYSRKPSPEEVEQSERMDIQDEEAQRAEERALAVGAETGADFNRALYEMDLGQVDSGPVMEVGE